MYNYNTDSLGLILGVEVFFSGGHCSGALWHVMWWVGYGYEGTMNGNTRMSISGYPADNVSVDVSPASQVSPVMTGPAHYALIGYENQKIFWPPNFIQPKSLCWACITKNNVDPRWFWHLGPYISPKVTWKRQNTFFWRVPTQITPESSAKVVIAS